MQQRSFSWNFQKDPLHFTTFQTTPTTWSVLIRINYNLRGRLYLTRIWARLLIRTPWSLKDVNPSRINNRIRALVMSQLCNYGVISSINLELKCNSLPHVLINCTEADFESVRFLFQDEIDWRIFISMLHINYTWHCCIKSLPMYKCVITMPLHYVFHMCVGSISSTEARPHVSTRSNCS